MDKQAILQVKNLHTQFKTDQGNINAVNNISYTLHKKEILGIVGESGSGKTVSSMSLMRLYDDNPNTKISGEVLFRGENILSYSKKQMLEIRGAKIAMIFQNPMSCLNPFLTIGQQLVETILLHKNMIKKTINKNEAHNYAIEMLKKVHIPDPEKRITQYPHHFSGGMRQRVMIAIALCCEPEILIADEPTTALDVTVQAQILDLIEELIQNFNTAVIFITHDMGVVARLCEQVCVMYAGKIVERGNVQDIFHNPVHPYTKGLLESIPHINKTKNQSLLSIPGNPPDLLHLPAGCSFAPRCKHSTDICNTTVPKEKIITASSQQDIAKGFTCFNPLSEGGKK